MGVNDGVIKRNYNFSFDLIVIRVTSIQASSPSIKIAKRENTAKVNIFHESEQNKMLIITLYYI
jgi:hypothetical protein